MCRRGTNIYKRKDGRWEGRYLKGYDENEKRILGYVYGRTYREALEKKQKAQALYEEKMQKKAILFDKAAMQWLEEKKKKVKISSYLKYQGILERHILPEFGEKSCCDIDTEYLQAFLMRKQSNEEEKAAALSQRSVRTMYHLIREILIYVENTYQIETNIKKIKFGKANHLPGAVFTADELKILKTAAETGCREDRRCLGILMCMYTGLRIGELCALRWSDIHMDLRLIEVTRTVQRMKRTEEADGIQKDEKKKAGKTYLYEGTPKTITSRRQIPICQHLYELLKEYYGAEKDSDYFLSGSSNCIEPRNFQYFFRHFQKKNNMKPLNCHALRHTFATVGISAGIDVKTVSELLGHANVNITLNNYVHSSIEEKQRQIEKLSIYNNL